MEKYQSNVDLLNSGGFERIIDEELGTGSIVRISYFTHYKDGSIIKWTDSLIFEDEVWKMMPQYVGKESIRPPNKRCNAAVY